MTQRVLATYDYRNAWTPETINSIVDRVAAHLPEELPLVAQVGPSETSDIFSAADLRTADSDLPRYQVLRSSRLTVEITRSEHPRRIPNSVLLKIECDEPDLIRKASTCGLEIARSIGATSFSILEAGEIRRSHTRSFDFDGTRVPLYIGSVNFWSPEWAALFDSRARIELAQTESIVRHFDDGSLMFSADESAWCDDSRLESWRKEVEKALPIDQARERFRK